MMNATNDGTAIPMNFDKNAVKYILDKGVNFIDFL